MRYWWTGSQPGSWCVARPGTGAPPLVGGVGNLAGAGETPAVPGGAPVKPVGTDYLVAAGFELAAGRGPLSLDPSPIELGEGAEPAWAWHDIVSDDSSCW
jgi:hypothetical protein